MKKRQLLYFWAAQAIRNPWQTQCRGHEGAGAEAELFTSEQADSAKLAGFDAIAFGCPAMGAEGLEETEFALMFDAVKGSLSGKDAALFGSYGWGDGEWMRTWEEDRKSSGLNLVCQSVTCCEAPDDDALEACRKLGAENWQNKFVPGIPGTQTPFLFVYRDFCAF